MSRHCLVCGKEVSVDENVLCDRHWEYYLRRFKCESREELLRNKRFMYLLDLYYAHDGSRDEVVLDKGREKSA